MLLFEVTLIFPSNFEELSAAPLPTTKSTRGPELSSMEAFLQEHLRLRMSLVQSKYTLWEKLTLL